MISVRLVLNRTSHAFGPLNINGLLIAHVTPCAWRLCPLPFVSYLGKTWFSIDLHIVILTLSDVPLTPLCVRSLYKKKEKKQKKREKEKREKKTVQTNATNGHLFDTRPPHAELSRQCAKNKVIESVSVHDTKPLFNTSKSLTPV